MASIIISKLFFNGTGLEILMTKDEMIQLANGGFEQRLQEGETIKEITDNCLWILKTLEQELFDANCEELTIQIAMKIWGKDGMNKYMNWHYSIIILLKTGLLQDDDLNGWMTIEIPDLGKKNDLYKTVRLNKIFTTCENCRIQGTFKKCSGCKKVHYCDGACQKTHWKIHKPTCGMN